MYIAIIILNFAYTNTVGGSTFYYGFGISTGNQVFAGTLARAYITSLEIKHRLQVFALICPGRVFRKALQLLLWYPVKRI